MPAWYARVAVAAAIAAGVAELALAARGAVQFALWVGRSGDPVDADAAWFVAMALAAPSFALVALGWFTLFAARAARRGIEDGYLGVAAGLALSLGVLHFAAPPAWIAGALTTAVVGAALGGLAAWRGALARQ
jgi:hypothetical protein